MMLVWVLELTALLASDVAGITNSLGPEETHHRLEKRFIKKGPCAENWFYFAFLETCHRFFLVKKTWSDAEVMCNAQPHYANLVTVNSRKHGSFIVSVIRALSNIDTLAWIGLNDLCKEGTYRWVDGTSSGYRQWNSTQPDNQDGHEDCVLFLNTDVGKWYDAECGSGYGFVCSYNLRNQ